jgi:hypothetical protein
MGEQGFMEGGEHANTPASSPIFNSSIFTMEELKLKMEELRLQWEQQWDLLHQRLGLHQGELTPILLTFLVLLVTLLLVYWGTKLFSTKDLAHFKSFLICLCICQNSSLFLSISLVTIDNVHLWWKAVLKAVGGKKRETIVLVGLSGGGKTTLYYEVNVVHLWFCTSISAIFRQVKAIYEKNNSTVNL